MSKLTYAVCVVFLGLFMTILNNACTRTLPPYASERSQRSVERPLYAAYGKEETLFRYALRENSRLRWDECLAERAAYRARDMARKNYFAHRDPKTNKNPSWELIAACHPCRYAGENLSKGDAPPDEIHQALMNSRTHRKNIQDNKFDLLGIGCFKDICVQFFCGM